MDKAKACERLTFCGECQRWRPLQSKMIKEEYRGYIGICNRPGVGSVERYIDDFCSRGVEKIKEE